MTIRGLLMFGRYARVNNGDHGAQTLGSEIRSLPPADQAVISSQSSPPPSAVRQWRRTRLNRSGHKLGAATEEEGELP